MTLFLSGNLSFINSASFPIGVSAEKTDKTSSPLILLSINGNILIIDSGCFPINRHRVINILNSNIKTAALIIIIFLFLG